MIPLKLRQSDSRGSLMLNHRSTESSDDSESGCLFHDLDLEALHIVWPNVPLDCDIFGLSICSLVRDSCLLAKRQGHRWNRLARLVTSLSMVVFCLSIQVFLLSQVKRFVSAEAVHDVRLDYDRFECHMYDGHVTVLTENPFPEHRGIGGKYGDYFNRSNFGSLDAKVKAKVCRIPLSQPLFFSAVLYVWTLTCICEIRKCKEQFSSLILQTNRCDSMADALVAHNDDWEGSIWVIAQLTLPVKVILTAFLLLPRFLITLFLLWLGCRWLLATNDFSDLILNTVALEFILCFKDVMYRTIVPRRNMIDLENTHVKPPTNREPESCRVFIDTVTWSLLAGVWVVLYMGFPGAFNGWQQVLRGYQWDVHDICTSWIDVRFAD